MMYFFSVFRIEVEKSISSQAESIFAWNTFLLWLSIVAAFILSLHFPCNNLAAFLKIFVRFSRGVLDQVLHVSKELLQCQFHYCQSYDNLQEYVDDS